MNSRDLRALLDEVENIDIGHHTMALAELRSVMTAVVEHLFFRQEDLERERGM